MHEDRAADLEIGYVLVVDVRGSWGFEEARRTQRATAAVSSDVCEELAFTA